MKQDEFAARLKRETQGVRVSSRLRQTTLDAAYGKESIRMKKRIPALALAIVLSLVFCATALALAGRAGMLDYHNLFYNKYVPGKTDAAIEQDVLVTGDELVNVSVRELYYDGRTSRITVDVTPKDESIFLVGFDTESGTPWKSLNRMNPEFDGSDTRTAAEVFAQGGYTASYNVSIGLVGEDFLTGAGDYYYTEPGVLTFFLTDSYLNDLPEREVAFRVTLTPFLDSKGNRIEWEADQRITIMEELKLTSSATEEKVYVSTEPVTFGEIGVTLDQMQLYAKPQELYVRLYYTVSDTELNRSIYSANTKERDQLSLEFIDTAIVADTPFRQRLSEGPTGDVICDLLSEPDEMPLRWVKELTLGVNNLSDSYTLRVYDTYTEARYDSAVVAMREATAEEIAGFAEGR